MMMLTTILFDGTHANVLGSAVPVLKILFMCGMGSALAHPMIRVINPESCKVLSKLVFALFLPCLIFTELGRSVTVENMREWWFIPVNVLLSAVIGCGVGYIVALICRPPPQFFKFTVVLTGIGNTGNLPLAIIGSVCHGDNPFGDGCFQRGVAYVSFAQWVAVLIVYTFVYHMLEPPMDFYELVQEIEPVEDPAEMPRLLEAEWPGVKDAQTDDTRAPLLSRLFREDSRNEEGSEGVSPRRGRCLVEPRVVRKIRIVAEKTPLQHILQPPTVASLLGIVVGAFPQLSSILFGQGSAPLAFFTDALTILAAAMVPCVMLVLGGVLSGGPGRSELGLRTTIGICFTRLVILPLVGFGVIFLAYQLGFVPKKDKMFLFVLLLQHAMPSAILSGAMTSLRGYGESEASAVLFWQHIFAVISIAVYITIYLQILSTI
ncbi:hypothetical protein O6H91_09G040900 [Diphasiastrum complanatum]|uniref:Uncharacterized protein n=1 Tax=Diphasiastrum complanatum TaxID=34168 RepID=A0ACC2CNC2_DIPCM|nr:hypothetical protein O6H91_Y510900 [Diphasiastrum complanatum]KAJ7195407.1 hypothetical protein O6H91_Y510900 [Diphasiastrum complanatum]KAJ7543506.1 hypothetical protein O6H91_09G040900 [Diphasiastrum complanatum]